jgi:hypothetical protein
MNEKAREAAKAAEANAIVRAGAEVAQRLGATADLNPHPNGSDESKLWAKGFVDAAQRLNDLFLAWLALGHSIPKLAIGSAGQALGPMVAGLVASNGNTAGALLVGALASHDGRTLAKILPCPADTRRAFEATQYGITGHDLPEEIRGDMLAEYFFEKACEIDRFREPGTETDVEEIREGEPAKVALVKFDLASYLKALVEGLPKEGGAE